MPKIHFIRPVICCVFSPNFESVFQSVASGLLSVYGPMVRKVDLHEVAVGAANMIQHVQVVATQIRAQERAAARQDFEQQQRCRYQQLL